MLHSKISLILLVCASLSAALPQKLSLKNVHSLHRDRRHTYHPKPLKSCILDHENEIDSVWVNNCETRECETFQREVTDIFNKTVNPCSNIHTFACSSENRYFIDDFENMKNAMEDYLHPKTILNDLTEDIEKRDNFNNETQVVSADVELRLYENCLKSVVGNQEVPIIRKLASEVDVLNMHWLEIDELTGYDDYSFFDISVTYHPFEKNKNIIVLQLPSSKSEYMTNLRKIMDIPREKLDPNNEFTQASIFLLDFIDIYKQNTKITEGYSYMTIRDFSKLLERDHYKDPSVKIDWPALFKRLFKIVGHDVTEDEYILVDSLQYFKEMTKRMSTLKKRTMHEVIQFKILAEFWYYALPEDYPMDSEQRKTYCANQVELFGITYKMLHQSINEKDEKSHHALQKIISTYESRIESTARSKYLRKELHTYLRVQLQEATESLIKGKWTEEEISDFYGNFEFSDNHVMDLIKYRGLIKLKTLKALRDTSGKAIRPFSVDDKYATKSFLINSYIFEEHADTLNLRGVFYGIESFNIARNIYIYINNKLTSGTVHKDATRFRKYLINGSESVDLDSADLWYDYQALDITYEAMFEHCYSQRHEQFIDFPGGNSLKTDVLFFLTYLKTHCISRKDVDFRNLFVDNKEYADSFGCLIEG